VWYQPAPDYYFSAPCDGTSPDGYIRQVTDPVYGNFVMDFAAGQNRDNGFWDSAVTMSTFVRDPTDPGYWALFLDFPVNSYTRWCGAAIRTTERLRWKSAHRRFLELDRGLVHRQPCRSSYCDGSGGQKPCSPLEIDIIEDWGDNIDMVAYHNWYDGGIARRVTGGQPSAFYDQTKYNKVGVLVTSDGSMRIKGCAISTTCSRAARITLGQ
jgi:hypothetical protein